MDVNALPQGHPEGKGLPLSGQMLWPILWHPKRRNSGRSRGSEQNQAGLGGLGPRRRHRRPLALQPGLNFHLAVARPQFSKALGAERQRPTPGCPHQPSPLIPPCAPGHLPPSLLCSPPLHGFRIEVLWEHTPNPSQLLEDKDLSLLSWASRVRAFNHR